MKPFSRENEPRARAPIRRLRPWLGTFVEIRVNEGGGTQPGGGAPADRALEGALEAGFDAIAVVHRLMSFFDPVSELSRLNRARPGEWVRLNPQLIEVLKAAEAVERLSAGAFNVAAAAGAPGAFETEPVSESGACVRARRLKDALLDLGGIAKGYAVDRAVEAIERALPGAWGLVNAGGDLRVFSGDPAREQTIHLRAERDEATRSAPLLYELSLASGAVATSSREAGTFSVIASECLWADALTKVAARARSPEARARFAGCLKAFGASALAFDRRGRLIGSFHEAA